MQCASGLGRLAQANPEVLCASQADDYDDEDDGEEGTKPKKVAVRLAALAASSTLTPPPK